MKIVLAGISSKFIHTNLAIWYLKASVPTGMQKYTLIKEYSINECKDTILSDIYLEKPEILAFSCYIWNFEMILAIASETKKLLPDCKIILGGPEVSYNSSIIMEEYDFIDFVLSGEGEEVFPVLINSLSQGTQDYKSYIGISYRDGEAVICNEGFNLVKDLNTIQSPYTAEMLNSVSNRIMYYESSRGCPFSCSYCISSTYDGVRYFSMERVKKDLDTIVACSPKLIKFVDRTFNCNKQRAKQIIKYVLSLDSTTLFHFEAAADLFDDELLSILSSAKKGTIQLEIGIQTTNCQTLEEIDRVTVLDKLFHNVQMILGQGNIHVHLDLIAGLPYEDLPSFITSFNQVHALQPHQLQLGFLKLLKGSKLRQQAEIHGYMFRSYAPYEVLCNKYISYEEILLLKDVEEVFERYYNSARFSETLKFMAGMFENAFDMYYRLSVYCREKGYLDRPVSYRENISILYAFYLDIQPDVNQCEELRQIMIADFASSDSSGSIPESIRRGEDFLPMEDVHRLLQSDGFIARYLPDLTGLKNKEIIKKVQFLKLDKVYKNDQILMMDYTKKDQVTGWFRKEIIDAR